MKTPRPYQSEAIRAALSAIHRGQEVGCWVHPTGLGKTFATVTLAGLLNARTLFLVHRDELIRQTAATVDDLLPHWSVGVVQGTRNEWDADFVVASVQSLSLSRINAAPLDRFHLCIADECHHAAAVIWRRFLERMRGKDRFTLGVSATPERLDGQGLAEFFGDEPLHTVPLRQAIEGGWLARLRQIAVKTETDLDGVVREQGRMATGMLAKTVNTPERNRCLAEAWEREAKGRPTIAFAADVAHAAALAESLEAVGARTATVHASMGKDFRRDCLERFKAGKLDVLTNCEILVEGFDEPQVSCILMARPTESMALYTQCIGRGLRLSPGKDDCIVLDATDNCYRHKLVNVTSLLGRHHERPDFEGQDVLEAIALEEKDEEERQKEMASRPEAVLRWKLEAVCPWPELPTLEGYEATSGWKNDEATPKQIGMLKRLGLDLSRTLTKGEAGYLLDQAMSMDNEHPLLATPKQEWLLRMHGLYEVGMSRREAGRRIGELKKKPKAESKPAVPADGGGMHMRRPCGCGEKVGVIQHKSGQDCVYCRSCGKWQYNAPRSETVGLRPANCTSG